MSGDRRREAKKVSASPTGPSSRRALSAMVLAAGLSTRFRGTKLLAEIGGKTLLEKVIDALPADVLQRTVVVLGHEAERVAARVRRAKGPSFIVNKDYRLGMSTSLRVGMGAIPGDASAVMVVLGDQPFVTRALLKRIRQEYANARRGSIVAAVHHGVVSPPVIFPRRYFPELMSLEGDRGARVVIERHLSHLHPVRVRSGRVLRDIDTRKDLEESGSEPVG